MAETEKKGGYSNKGLRISDDSMAFLKSLCEQNKWTYEDVMRKFKSLYEMAEIKKTMVNRQAEAEQVEYHLEQLQQAFINSWQMYEDTENVVKMKFQDKLESNSQTIQDLQDTNKKLTSEIGLLKQQYDDMAKQKQTDEKTIAELEKKIVKSDELAGSYREKNDMLNGMLTEYQHYKNENVTLKANFDKIQQDNQKLNNMISDKDTNHNKAISDKDIEHKTAVLDLKAEQAKAIEQLKDKHSSEIEKRNQEYRELLGELEKIRKSNYELMLNQKEIIEADPVLPHTENESIEKNNPKGMTYDDALNELTSRSYPWDDPIK